MWAAKGRAVETHGGWRQERAAEAPEEEPGCRTVYWGLESCLGSVLGRLSLRFWRRHVHFLRGWRELLLLWPQELGLLPRLSAWGLEGCR